MNDKLKELYAKGLGNLNDEEQTLFVKLLNEDEQRKYDAALTKTNHDLFELMQRQQL